MRILRQFTTKIPTYALPYLINGDNSGLEESEIRTIDRWYDNLVSGYIASKKQLNVILLPEDDSYHSTAPAFGLPCCAVDCEVIVARG